MCTSRSLADDDVFNFFLIDTDVFCSMILFLFIDDNALKFPPIYNHFVRLKP